MKSSSKSRLGRGLGNLITQGIEQPEQAATIHSVQVVENTPSGQAIQEVLLKLIDPNPYQPRRTFVPESIRELADSIRSEGLLQPIVVRKKENRYEIIAGERRFRACELLALKTIPVRIIEASNMSSAVISMIENLQREDLNPIDEALGYASLIQDFNLTQEAVAERVGKARASIANALRLLQLDKDVQGYLSKSMLSTGHAKVLLSLSDKTQQSQLARRIIEQGLSVRETERTLRQIKEPARITGHMPKPAAQALALQTVQKGMTAYLNTKVTLKHTAKRGQITIDYYGDEDLERLMRKIGMTKHSV